MAPFPSPTATWHGKPYPSIPPTRAELSAKGKTIVITGGGSGIGAATASSFAAAGASRIALLGRREQPLIETKATINHKFPNVDVFVASTDVTKKSDADKAFAKFVGARKVHILISNAAMTGPHEPVSDVDPNAFLNGIQQNLQGSLFVAQAFLRYAASEAVVISVCSLAAHLNITTKFPSYSVAKIGVFRLWDSVAFGHPDFSIFHTQPGVVDTAMNREAGGVNATGLEDDGKLHDQIPR